MAYTFFKADQLSVGRSLVEDHFIPVARKLMDVGMQSRCKMLLPIDIVAAQSVDARDKGKIILIKEGIPEGFEGVDIGPKTVEIYCRELQRAGMVFWNGPLGVFEKPPFNQGTNEIAHCVGALSANTIVGGGDTIAAVDKAGEGGNMNYLSMGGGAALEDIELGTLPGIEALSNK